jgi:hypothetical protein
LNVTDVQEIVASVVNRRRQVTFLRKPWKSTVVCYSCGIPSDGNFTFLIEPYKNYSDVHRKFLCLSCASLVPRDAGLKTQIANAIRRSEQS